MHSLCSARRSDGWVLRPQNQHRCQTERVVDPTLVLDEAAATVEAERLLVDLEDLDEQGI